MFAKVLRAAGESTIVSLTGLGSALPVLIHEVDLEPLTGHPRHVDFYAVTKGEKIEVAIPLVFIGESLAVKNGANLVKVLHELEVESDPMSMPNEIEVDLSILQAVGDQIHANDIALPAGTTLVTEPEDVVALAQEVVEEDVGEVASIDSIEVEKKGKGEAGVAAED